LEVRGRKVPNFVNLVEAIQELETVEDRGITFINNDRDEIHVPFRLLYERALEVLHCLQSKGILPGQELVFQIEDNETFLYVFCACILGRFIAVPVSVGSKEEHRLKLIKIWEILKAPYLIGSQKVLSNLEKCKSAVESGEAILGAIKSNIVLIEKLKFSGKKGTPQIPSTKDIAFIQFSSGSTGNPKGVMLTHENLLVNVTAFNKVCGSDRESVLLSWVPLTHDLGLIAVYLGSILAGSSLYIMPTRLFVAKPVLWIKKAYQHKVTHLYSPNFGYQYFLQFFSAEAGHEWDLSHISFICNGAEPISIPLCKRFMAALAPYGLKESVMKLAYGLSEASVAVSGTRFDESYRSVSVDRRFLKSGQMVRPVDREDMNGVELADVGAPIDDCHVRICGSDGRPVGDWIVGSIQICGRNVTQGYYNDREVTDCVMRGDGWLDTGDLGFIRDGRLVITGRAKDIIFMNGQNYYPYDIERATEGFAGGKFWRTAACGVFDKEHQTEQCVLFVLFKRNLEEFIKTTSDLRVYLLEKIGVYIEHILPVKSLPRTTSGKIQRYKLAEQYMNGEFASLIKEMERAAFKQRDVSKERNEAMTATEKNLVDIYREVIGTGMIDVSENLVDLGENSIILTKISEQIDRIYPGRVTVANLFAYPTIKQLAEFIDRDDNLQIPALKIPQSYFVTERHDGEDNFFETVLEEEVYHKLLQVAKSVETGVTSVLLSMYIYLLKEVSEEKRIPVQVLLNESTAVSIEIDFEQVRDYESFFRLVELKLVNSKSESTYMVKNSYRARIQKESSLIVPFFYSRGRRPTDIHLIHVYDLILQVHERKNSADIICEYNKRLCREKIKELLAQYLWLVTELIAKYGNN
jgi:fatty-acyl-CoA synthase